ncbi:PREDICTED: uncharacterized protein LOC109183394 [Ipomoea nil]|uniref:uncharacterized protein LOC109183394 n=1 Tax=Ipomoea nil TaxID=35883 RepID=UPI000901AB2A|nr:PREDICTED: uncharacterized protein LOC109183394 [Ipomoea nil]
MSNIISPSQGSFVSERQITDNIVIYHEILHTITTEKNQHGYMVLKIDLEKAYDRLDWNFIRDTLLKVSLNDTWTRNIMHCVEGAEMSILWEGRKLDSFKPERGVRQGDSISPYLFVLCIERLCHIITEAVTQGRWKGIKVSRNGPSSISHLFFADDMVLFAEASKGKPDMHDYGMPRQVLEDANEIASLAGIPATDDLGRYLGVPSLHGRVTKDHCKAILDRVRGRQILAQSVLNAIPTYAMQTMLLPKGVCDAIDKTTRNFLWGGDGTKRKTSLVKWDTVTLPKEEEKSIAKMTRKRNESNSWKGICAAAHILEKGAVKVVANGRNTSFWEDHWIGEKPLKNFLIGPLNRNAGNTKIVDVWDERGYWNWNAIDIGLHPEKRAELSVKILINDARKHDRIGWGPNEDKIFSTKLAYSLTRQHTGIQSTYDWKAISAVHLAS